MLRFSKVEKVLSGSEAHTTNNRMELTAALQSLQYLKTPCRIDFYADSNYLKRGITEWLANWRENKWKRKSSKLANALDLIIQNHQIRWHWVPGHTGHRDNERVDRPKIKCNFMYCPGLGLFCCSLIPARFLI